MTIGEKIRQLRKDRGFTQEAVASALEVRRQAIAKWENGQSSPSTENLLKLANLFNISLEELVDVKQYSTPALEEYARRKIEEDEKRKEKRQEVYKKTKEISMIFVAYIAVYLVSMIVFHVAGLENCIWNWMKNYQVLLITCAFSVATALLNRKIASMALFIGSIAAIIVANIAGMANMQNSLIRYNNGWVFYLITLFVSFIVGYIIEFKVAGLKVKAMKRGCKVARGVFIVVLFVAFSGCVFLSIRHVKFGLGTENGYKDGYDIGVVDAQEGKPMNQNFSTGYFPTQYEFGSTEFKGYAIYWPEGYKCGYAHAFDKKKREAQEMLGEVMGL